MPKDQAAKQPASDKKPSPAAEPRAKPASSAADQAERNEKRAIESGEESPA